MRVENRGTNPMIELLKSHINVDGEPILSVECDEPEGIIIRHVRPMLFTPANLRMFWEKARQHRTLMATEIRDSYETFTGLILRMNSSGGVEASGLFWVVDDFVGMFSLTDIRPGIDALVHYSFFDGRHRGRIKLVREAMKYLFREYGFRRLTVEIPLYATEQTHNFVHKSLGFKKEGRKRKAVQFDKEWFDMNVYGILKEEVL